MPKFVSIQDPAIQKAEASLRARRRHYPKFIAGKTTVEEYVKEYYRKNAMRWVPTSFGIQRGAYTDMHSLVRLDAQVEAFFEPLSKEPQRAADDTVVEEVQA